MQKLIAIASLTILSATGAYADDFNTALSVKGNPLLLSAASAPQSPRSILDYVLVDRTSAVQGVVTVSTVNAGAYAIEDAARRL